MANSKGPSSVRSTLYNGKNSLLPPKSPFPSISPSYTEYIPTSTIGPKTLPKHRDQNSHHQRTSSESFLIDEQPSWLDELLDEPETPVRKGGHRRSSSDSFAYMDMFNAGGTNYMARDDPNRYKNVMGAPLSQWGSQDFDIYRDARQQNSFYVNSNQFGRTRNKLWDPPGISGLPRGIPSPKGNSTVIQNVGLLSTLQNADKKNVSLPPEKKEAVEPGHQDPKGPAEKKEAMHGKSSETDNKRAKQQFAQRSRVRKLQYIAELERNVQALQADGSEASAELEFINQQNLILNMENKALKQRLESLAQEQLIKYLEHEVLEREVSRLRNLYQQHQQLPPHQPQTSSAHRRANSRDLDQQFLNLSLKNKEATAASRDSVSGQPLHM
ncbi:Basic-leucine zipper (bZIP) transcription factor family protein [Striga hermonthica]|uniref:Basic-leucine zipper (BZIP) transcription factor family protein n=1 Tax=Striga hermonthica TaxID=68872 RepID=A0A9N7RTN0_STRHE|nr:Basic-leucine zipper (bZIP) transcription factor family protein [Striga hermonthica]